MPLTIGSNIRAIRLELGMNQKELAEKLELTQAHISRMESSLKGPGAEMLLAVAGALDCDVCRLMGIETPVQKHTHISNDINDFIAKIIEVDPQIGILLRTCLQKNMTENDGEFMARILKLTIKYAADVIDINISWREKSDIIG